MAAPDRGVPTMRPWPSSHAAAGGFCSAVRESADCGNPPRSSHGGRRGRLAGGAGDDTARVFWAWIDPGGTIRTGTAVPCCPRPGRPGMGTTTSRRSRANVAARASRAFRIQPSWPSPTRSLTTALVAWSVKTPMLPSAPITVPTRLSCGRAGGAATGGGGGGGGAATRTGGGRRDGENSGRSRVADSVPSGTRHNGFPRAAGSGDRCGAKAAAVAGATPHAHAPNANAPNANAPNAHAPTTQAKAPTVQSDRA